MSDNLSGQTHQILERSPSADVIGNQMQGTPPEVYMDHLNIRTIATTLTELGRENFTSLHSTGVRAARDHCPSESSNPECSQNFSQEKSDATQDLYTESQLDLNLRVIIYVFDLQYKL